MKKVLIIVCITILCCSCQQNPIKNNTSSLNASTESPQKNNWTVAGKSNVDVTLRSISEVRTLIESDFRELQEGKYGNISTEDISVTFPENDYIYNISYDSNEYSDDNNILGTKIIDKVSEIEERIKEYEGDEYIEGNLKIHVTNFQNKKAVIGWDNDYNEELINKINNGEYDDRRLSNVLYKIKKNNYSYVIGMNCTYTGICFEFNKIEYLGFSEPPFYIPGRDAYKIYNKYSNNEDKNDKYRLLTGDVVSIQEAIDYIENDFFANAVFPIEENYKHEVIEVCVAEYDEDAYVFQCFLLY